MDLSRLPKPNGLLWIYALELVGGHYYIGSTTWPKNRMQLHLKGQAAQFTRKHPPIKVLACYPGPSLEEKQLTLEYMDTYGSDKVRGWCYTSSKSKGY